jgi:hypothetical protein
MAFLRRRSEDPEGERFRMGEKLLAIATTSVSSRTA